MLADESFIKYLKKKSDFKRLRKKYLDEIGKINQNFKYLVFIH